MADRARDGDAATAIAAIVIASLSNTVVKTGMVAVLGANGLRRLIVVSGAIILVAGAAVLLANRAVAPV